MAWYSIFRKKKKEELALEQPSLTKLELGLPGLETGKEKEAAPTVPPFPTFEAPIEKPSAFEVQQLPQRDISKDIELISAKLDAIKAMVENLNHRLDKIEMAQAQKDKKYVW